MIDIRVNVEWNGLYFSFLEAYATQAMKSAQGLVLASEPTKLYFERLARSCPEVHNPVVEKIKANME